MSIRDRAVREDGGWVPFGSGTRLRPRGACAKLVGHVSSEEPKLLVSSMGGVGSTMLMEFLAATGARVNGPHGVINPLKHAVAPPLLPSIERAIFVFGCPHDSLLSLFRRGYDAAHYVTVHGYAPEEFPWPGDAWAETCKRFRLRQIGDTNKWVDEAGRHASEVGAIEWFRAHKHRVDTVRTATLDHIRRIARSAYRDLDDLLEQGVDHFRRAEQVQRWSDGVVPYPVMLVRYETMWLHVKEILAFADVKPATAFPIRQARVTDHRALPEARKAKLELLYGELKARIDAMPDARIRRPESSPCGST